MWGYWVWLTNTHTPFWKAELWRSQRNTIELVGTSSSLTAVSGTAQVKSTQFLNKLPIGTKQKPWETGRNPLWGQIPYFRPSSRGDRKLGTYCNQGQSVSTGSSRDIFTESLAKRLLHVASEHVILLASCLQHECCSVRGNIFEMWSCQT